LDIRHEDFVKRPAEELKRICDYLDIEAPEDWVSSCVEIVYEKPNRSRFTIVWPHGSREAIAENLSQYSFLKHYNFEDTKENLAKIQVPNFFSRFTNYPDSPTVRREDYRYHAIIRSQPHIYKDANVLDLAGFWGYHSFGALEHGAKHVTIIDARDINIKNGERFYKANKVDSNKYKFVQGNVHDILQTYRHIDQFDVVLVCGFLYHSAHHLKVIEDIAKYVAPKYQVYDTALYKGEEDEVPPVTHYLFEDAGSPINGVAEAEQVLVAWPSRSALKLMLEATGYKFFYEFPKQEWAKWVPDGSSNDYAFGMRATLFFEKA